jgi:hypothetical protein
VDRSGFSPPIATCDPRNLLVPAVGGGDETILRDLKLTLALNAGVGWLKQRCAAQQYDGGQTREACLGLCS